MSMSDFLSTVIREYGLRHAYNYLHFFSFYNTKKPKLIKLLQWLEPYPTYVEIETTTYCGFRCIMCEHTYWKQKPQSMTFEQFKAIVEQFPRLKWIGITGIGEGYLNRDFHKMIRYCTEERGLIVEIYDAFYYIEQDKAEELIDMGVDQIFCSMDAATKETYERMRPGSDFDKVVRNLRQFVSIRTSRGKFFPVLDFHFIINKINSHEIIPYIELVAEIAPGSKIQFSRLLHCYEQIENLYMEIPEETMEKARQRCSELGVKMFWNQNVSGNKSPQRNCITWYMPFIFVTGEVIPCCSGNEANQREKQQATSLGNIFENPFDKIWWGEKYRQLRKNLRNGITPESCTNCSLYGHRDGQSL
jgi:MoaA/NifB/PqqE/SkfB family radical SAM enzyme